MNVRNKLESIELIKKLNLNRLEEQLFTNNQEKEITDFIKKYPYDYYAIRSKSIVGCKKNQFKVPRNEVIAVSKSFDLFTINVSSYNFTKHLILIGDIRISKEGEVWLIASTNPNYTGKMAELNPDYNINTTLDDKSLSEIPGFDMIFKYIVDHQLIDVIVELALYNIPLGINQENVIVFEIRTEF